MHNVYTLLHNTHTHTFCIGLCSSWRSRVSMSRYDPFSSLLPRLLYCHPQEPKPDVLLFLYPISYPLALVPLALPCPLLPLNAPCYTNRTIDVETLVQSFLPLVITYTLFDLPSRIEEKALNEKDFKSIGMTDAVLSDGKTQVDGVLGRRSRWQKFRRKSRKFETPSTTILFLHQDINHST